MENEINRWTAEMKIVNKGNLIAIGDVTLDRVIKIKKVKVLSLKDKNGDELILIELPRQKITKEGKTIWHSICRTLTSESRKNLEKAVMDSLKTELAKDLFVDPEIIVHIQVVRNKGNLKAYAKIEYDGIFEISVLWSSFFVTFLANKIKLLSVSILAVSATLDNGAEGYYQIVADSDDLKNRFFFLVSVGEKVSYPSAPLSRACPFGVAAFYLQL